VNTAFTEKELDLAKRLLLSIVVETKFSSYRVTLREDINLPEFCDLQSLQRKLELASVNFVSSPS
jgi:hypothetical protein